MSGTKPPLSASRAMHIIVREFRGSRLYLASVAAHKGMHWTDDKAKSLKLTAEEALQISERASREWGAACAVLDSEGNLAQRQQANDQIATRMWQSAERVLPLRGSEPTAIICDEAEDIARALVRKRGNIAANLGRKS